MKNKYFFFVACETIKTKIAILVLYCLYKKYLTVNSFPDYICSFNNLLNYIVGYSLVTVKNKIVIY